VPAREPEQRRELLDASPQRQDLLPEFRLREGRPIQAEHDRRRGAEPPTRRRARNAEIRRDGQVPGASDEIPSPRVVALLRPVVVVMRMIIGSSLAPLNSSSVMRGVSASRQLTQESAECP
jgi:hypothetical protein